MSSNPGQMLDADRLRHMMEMRGNEYADADYDASALEETKSIVLAEIYMATESKTAAEREQAAKANPRYREHIERMVEARRLANRARASLEALRLYSDALRTNAATERALLQMR